MDVQNCQSTTRWSDFSFSVVENDVNMVTGTQGVISLRINTSSLHSVHFVQGWFGLDT